MVFSECSPSYCVGDELPAAELTWLKTRKNDRGTNRNHSKEQSIKVKRQNLEEKRQVAMKLLKL